MTHTANHSVVSAPQKLSVLSIPYSRFVDEEDGPDGEFAVIDDGEQVFLTNVRSLAEIFCDGAGLPRSAVSQLS